MKRAAALLALALADSQAGHLLAYEVRFGPAAMQMQSAGAHAYFPMLVKTVAGAGALALVGLLFLVGFARLAAGGKIVKSTAPSLLRLAAVLYTVQLACFVVQENIEGGSASEIVLWGLLGQLPVALVGASALRWLLARVAPALAALGGPVEPALQLLTFATTPLPMLAPIVALEPRVFIGGSLSRRGPPASF